MNEFNFAHKFTFALHTIFVHSRSRFTQFSFWIRLRIQLLFNCRLLSPKKKRNEKLSPLHSMSFIISSFVSVISPIWYGTFIKIHFITITSRLSVREIFSIFLFHFCLLFFSRSHDSQRLMMRIECLYSCIFR